MVVYFVTGSERKVREAKSFLDGRGGVDFVQVNIDVEEIQGTKREVAAQKVKTASEILIRKRDVTDGFVMVEDVSLSLHALGGFPGPYVKWMLEAMPLSSVVRSLADFEEKSATAYCIYAVQRVENGTLVGEPNLFEGEVRGTIVDQRGEGYGFDPIFLPDGHEKTLAEMAMDEKATISHRSNALRKIVF